MTETRAGVVGLGMMGRHHVRVLGDLAGVELVGVVDPMGDVHGAAPGVPILETVGALIELGVDLAIVAVPTEEHEEVAVELVAAGVSVMVEKPLAVDAAAGARIIEAVRAAGVVGGVGHVERYNPAVRSLRARLDAGELGEIYQIATSRQGPFPERIRDVGVVKDLATHDLDLAMWVADSPFVSIGARCTYRAGRPHEDLVAATGWLESEVVTNHLVNWLTPTKERRIVVTGAKGCFVADTLAADLTFFANGEVRAEWDTLSQFRGVSEGDMVRYAIPKPEPIRVELEGFVAAVRGTGGSLVSLEDGLRAVVVAEAVVESAQTGRSVTIPSGAW